MLKIFSIIKNRVCRPSTFSKEKKKHKEYVALKEITMHAKKRARRLQGHNNACDLYINYIEKIINLASYLCENLILVSF